MKKKVLIVTLNDYIIYQPTILNLYDELLPHFDVKIISFQPQYVTTQKDDIRNIKYLDSGRITGFLLGKYDFLMSKISSVVRIFRKDFQYEYRYYNHYLPSVLAKWLREHETNNDIVIAVDLPALSVAQKVYGPVHFLSLEVENRESGNYRKIDVTKIRSVFIQSGERKEYLFPGAAIKTFIVQNAPVFYPAKKQQADRQDFIYAGTARAVFGIFECIEFIRRYPPFKLVQKGGGEKKILQRIRKQYAELISSGRLRLDDSYLPMEKFIPYLSGFRIGFCFYSWDWIEKYFNYRTAPSGKLFMYMAAGVPVIASDIPGFKIVRDYKAGVLVRDYDPATIKAAVDEIEKDFDQYSTNCYKMAADLSFDKTVQPYIRFLLQE